MAPGKWIHDQTTSFWTRYLYFVGIRQQNDQLRQELDAAKDELTKLREDATEVVRLRRLLSMTPPEDWSRKVTRIITHRLGPNAALETFIIDKGSASGVAVNTPVVSPDGVVGRVLRISPTAATILLITDPNSRIPVVSQKNRTQGVLKGEGPGNELQLEYVAQGAPVEVGEVLVTSGLGEIFPKGLPVARVTSVGRTGASLFQFIKAEPLFSALHLEEVALLFKTPPPSMVPVAGQAPAGGDVPKEPELDKVSKHLKTPAAIPPAPNQGAPIRQAVPATSAAVKPAAPATVKPASAPSRHERTTFGGSEKKKRRRSAKPEGR